MAQERATWQRERALIEAQAAQSIAELRTRVIELERKLEGLMQQKLLDVDAMVQARLTAVRDGERGERGEVGERGEIGLQGPAGAQGEPGYGSEGKVGPQGEQGEQGPKGDSVKGECGEAGPQGQQGQAGQDGQDGLSIIGPEGPRGAAGPRGEQGLPGRDGERGERGEPGAIGQHGERGDRGERGAMGVPGRDGMCGERGARGEPGERGIKGDSGETIIGPIGPSGKLPRVKDWQPDVVFYDGSVVRHERGTWQALKDTSQRPGAGEDWSCIAAGGLDARTPQVRSTYDPAIEYEALDIVVSNGGSFIARRDRPGPCPGDDWQMIARQGQRGIAGEKGERGEPGARGLQGEPGKPAPVFKGWTVDRQAFVAVPLMSDGTRGPTLELRGLFEQFQSDTD